MKYDFDKIIDRRGTASVKVDGIKEHFGCDDLIPMWVADMDFEVATEISDAITQRINHHIYGYAIPSPEYKLSIVHWLKNVHNRDVSVEHISYMPGVVKGIAFAINYFTKKGDGIIIQPPVYHPFKMLIEGNSRKVVSNPLIRTDNGYEMDFANLEQVAADENTKLMILCNPHNPAGITWSKETLNQVAKICNKHNVLVISDEIHCDLALFGNKFVPFSSVSDEARNNCITFGAPSKTFNIPGLVSSFCITEAESLRTPFFTWLESNEFNDATFMATIATEAAYNHGAEWLSQVKGYIENNIMFVEEYMHKYIPQIKPMRPEASYLVWLDCRELCLSQPDLVNLFIKGAHLALNDGSMFGEEGVGYMRMNVGTQRSVIIKALEALRNAVNAMK